MEAPPELHDERIRVLRRHPLQHGLLRERVLEFLVREHLAMSAFAQKRDLTDPQVLEAFAQRVGSHERLMALYLLTVADIRGTSPKVWNAWKAKLLEDLYHGARRVLDGERPDAAEMVDSTRREARRLLRYSDLTVGEISYRVGFRDQLYFSRAFKRHAGQPPQAYRESSRGH